jgi:hypothetical protein
MADPVSLAIIGSTVANTAVSAGGAFMGGQAQAGQYKAQAQAANYDATLAQQQGQLAAEVGASREAQSRRSSTALEGQQFAAIAQSGTGVTSGSAREVMRQQSINDQLDALGIRYEGQLEARGYNLEADKYRTEASFDRSNAHNADIGSYLGAGTALLSGAGSGFGAYKSVGGMDGLFPGWSWGGVGWNGEIPGIGVGGAIP